jgi:hypothetical protein
MPGSAAEELLDANYNCRISAYPETGVLEKMSWAQARWMNPR